MDAVLDLFARMSTASSLGYFFSLFDQYARQTFASFSDELAHRQVLSHRLLSWCCLGSLLPQRLSPATQAVLPCSPRAASATQAASVAHTERLVPHRLLLAHTELLLLTQERLLPLRLAGPHRTAAPHGSCLCH